MFDASAAAAFTNLATGAYWQGPAWSGSKDGFYDAGDPGFDERGDMRGIGPVERMNLRGLQAPPVQGVMTEVSWLEPNNPSGKSNWAVFPKTFPEGTNWAQRSAITYSGGRYRIRGIYQTSATNPVDSGALELYGLSDSNDFVDIRVAEVGADFSKELRDTYISRTLFPLRGEIRTMEVQNINDERQDYLWADRPKTDSARYGIYRMNGYSLETMLDMANLSDRPLSAIIGYRWSKELVQAFVRGMFRGTDMEGGRKLKANLYASISLVGNEPWNPFFKVYHLLVADGKAQLADQSGGDNEKRIKMQVIRSNQVREWIEEAVPEALDRIQFTWSGHPGNHQYEWFSIAKAAGIAGIHAVETSIYNGIGVKNDHYGNDTPTELFEPWDGDTSRQIDAAALGLDQYKAAGIVRKLYEYGEDMIYGVMSEQKKDAWVNSPEYADIKKRGLLRIASLFGPTAIYWDSGIHTLWAHQQRAGLPSPKWDTLLEVQAELAVAAS